MAPEVSVLAKVELPPFTERGSASRFCPKAPPERDDSAARESEVIAPGPSFLGFLNRSGSVVCLNVLAVDHLQNDDVV